MGNFPHFANDRILFSPTRYLIVNINLGASISCLIVVSKSSGHPFQVGKAMG
jgi:hypothetical protein